MWAKKFGTEILALKTVSVLYLLSTTPLNSSSSEIYSRRTWKLSRNLPRRVSATNVSTLLPRPCSRGSPKNSECNAAIRYPAVCTDGHCSSATHSIKGTRKLFILTTQRKFTPRGAEQWRLLVFVWHTKPTVKCVACVQDMAYWVTAHA